MELLIEPGLDLRTEVGFLRLKYLRCLLGEILPRDHSLLNTVYPLPDDTQRYLASTIGCVAVLQDLAIMVKSFTETSPKMRQELGCMIKIYERGEANSFLATIQKDFSSLFVARRF